MGNFHLSIAHHSWIHLIFSSLNFLGLDMRTAAEYHTVYILFQEKRWSNWCCVAYWCEDLIPLSLQKSREYSFFQGNCSNESLAFHRQAAPCTAADPLAVASSFQFLFTATAVAIYSGIWWWSLLGTPSAFLLKIAMLGSLYTSSLIPCSPVVCGILAEIWSCLERMLIWVVPREDALGLQACPVLVALVGMWDDSIPQHFLMMNNNARRNTWNI